MYIVVRYVSSPSNNNRRIIIMVIIIIIMCLTLVSHALACTRVSGQTLQACLYPDLREKGAGKNADVSD